jgi:hypothetical protein
MEPLMKAELTPTLSLDELAAAITELAGHLNAANHRWLTVIGEFDRRRGWAAACFPSCAHWLNYKCSLALGAAREWVRVARALEGLPRIGAAMACGQLSYSKVRAVTRVATAATEESLLMVALHGTAHHNVHARRSSRRCGACTTGATARAASSSEEGLEIDATTCLPQWGGERMVYGLAVGCLMWQEAAARDAAARDTGSTRIPAGTCDDSFSDD